MNDQIAKDSAELSTFFDQYMPLFKSKLIYDNKEEFNKLSDKEKCRIVKDTIEEMRVRQVYLAKIEKATANALSVKK